MPPAGRVMLAGVEAVRASGLVKQFGERRAPSTGSRIDGSLRPRCTACSAPTARARRPCSASCSGWSGPTRERCGRSGHSRCPTTGSRPAAGVAGQVEAPSFYPYLSARMNLRAGPARRRWFPRGAHGPARARRPRPPGRGPGLGLLVRDAPATRDRRRAPAPPTAPASRRADQRPGPGRHARRGPAGWSNSPRTERRCCCPATRSASWRSCAVPTP